MKSWRLFGGIALIFVLGIAAGSAGTLYYHEHRITTRALEDPAARKGRILKRLTRDLRLTPAQQQEFKGLVDQMVQERKELDQRILTEIRKSMDAGFLRMREKLGPEQQKLLEELKARYDERVKLRGKRIPPLRS